MFNRNAEPTAGSLRTMLHYDPESGAFTWRQARGTVKVGAVAGRVDRNGYRRIVIGKRRYLAHRLAWLYVYGEWPSGDLDHISRKRDDNRISNLRIATRSQNQGNSGPSRRNTSGFRGVTRYKGRWRALLQTSERKIHLGSFDTPEQASEIYKRAARAYYGEFAS